MGWSFCGADDLGREVGYGVEAECDYPTCIEIINRGLGYCCGSMHFGDNDDGCGRYFCEKHRYQHDCPYDGPASFRQAIERLIDILCDLDEFGRPKKKLPPCPKCDEDELGVIHADLILCYCCGWRVESKVKVTK